MRLAGSSAIPVHCCVGIGWEPQGEAALGNGICSEPGGGRKPMVELKRTQRESEGERERAAEGEKD